MKILVTGIDGFIGKNLKIRLEECGHTVVGFRRGESVDCLQKKVKMADFIFHLAGENRSTNFENFKKNNVELTRSLCIALKNSGKFTPVVFTSSVHAGNSSYYGQTKWQVEQEFINFSKNNPNHLILIYRLAGVFGKWCKPNYNSVVATFCHNVANGLELTIEEPQKEINLIYIDDVIDDFCNQIFTQGSGVRFIENEKTYKVTLKWLASKIQEFKSLHETTILSNVGDGVSKLLYATYLSYMPTSHFKYKLINFDDQRGRFVEVFKMPSHGQISFLTIKVGECRGGHYHHTKTEKFIVVRGLAKFKFRNLLTDQSIEIVATSDCPEVVQTIPGWAHEVLNCGDEEVIILLWANEIFNPIKPDTIALKP